MLSRLIRILAAPVFVASAVSCAATDANENVKDDDEVSSEETTASTESELSVSLRMPSGCSAVAYTSQRVAGSCRTSAAGSLHRLVLRCRNGTLRTYAYGPWAAQGTASIAGCPSNYQLEIISAVLR